jgi:hypothetical protein
LLLGNRLFLLRFEDDQGEQDHVVGWIVVTPHPSSQGLVRDSKTLGKFGAAADAACCPQQDVFVEHSFSHDANDASRLGRPRHAPSRSAHIFPEVLLRSENCDSGLLEPALQINPLLDFATDQGLKIRTGFDKIDLAQEQLQERVCARDDGRPLENRAMKIPTGDVPQIATPCAVQLAGSSAHSGGIHSGILGAARRSRNVHAGCKTTYCEVVAQFAEYARKPYFQTA